MTGNPQIWYDGAVNQPSIQTGVRMQSTTCPFVVPLDPTIPCVVDLHALAMHLACVPDRRAKRGVRYPLAVLLTIAVLAKLAGYTTPEAIADWAHLRRHALATIFGLTRPTMPHSDTWRRIFAHAVHPDDLTTALRICFTLPSTRGTVPARGDHVVALDGKTLRGTIPTGQTQGVHGLAVFDPARGVTLAQTTVDTKHNEITHAPALLASLDLRGRVVTGDAMQCQQALSRHVVEAGGDYCWFVKGNQPTLLADIEQVFAPSQPLPGWSDPPVDWHVTRTVEKRRGRIEERVLTSSALLADYTPWAYLAQVFKLECTVWDRQGQRCSTDIRYGVTSLTRAMVTTKRLAQIARQHWGIENGLHYRRDVTLREDAGQMRRGTAPANIAALNTAVIGIALTNGKTNLPEVQRAFAWAWDRFLCRHTP